MKTVFKLCAIAFLSVATVSCTKTEFSNNTLQSPPNTDPFISATISRNILQPAAMELGTPSAVLQSGDVVAIFVPFTSRNEAFASTTLSMIDANTGELLGTYNLSHSTDPSSADLIIPEDLRHDPNYLFLTFRVEDAFAGKTITLKTKLEGQTTSSEDEVTAAFSVNSIIP